MIDFNLAERNADGRFETEYLEVEEIQGTVRLNGKTRTLAAAFDSARPEKEMPEKELKAAVANRFEKADRQQACLRISDGCLARDESLQGLRVVTAACNAYLSRMLSFVNADYPPADKLLKKAFGTVKVSTNPPARRISWNNAPAIFALVVFAFAICIFSCVEATNIVVMLEEAEWLPNATRWQLYSIAVPYTVAFLVVSCAISTVRDWSRFRKVFCVMMLAA